MEELLQEEKQELEYKTPNEDQGGIRRRLRDRDLLRKRKAEAEEKETNQAEIQRKRQRVQNRSGSKNRGRPRKTESTPEITVIQEEPAVPLEASAVAVVSEPLEVIAVPSLGSITSLPAEESQPTSFLTAPAPLSIFESVQSPSFASAVTPSATANPTPALFSPSISAPAAIKDVDIAPVPVQDFSALDPAPDAVPVATLTQVPVLVTPPAPPAASSEVGALYEESEGREDLNQAMIEDLGPDEEADILLSQVKGADDANKNDFSETTLFSVSEPNKTSVSTLSSLPPSQE
ncbi:YLP motif-containing protein 1 isoform X2 [Antennarius striatus]|uniref:YLP motif-containing protein 1 isoform X2 n=1 Tax=Antennarius striatus TaxID=241820 RepID=UPI0035ADDF82